MQAYLDLIRYKVYAELSAEAARTFLGILWWLIEPVLYMSVFYLIFGVMFQRGGEGFVYFLLVALVVWKWFDSSIRNGMVSLETNAAVIQQVYQPKFIFPVIVVLINTAKFLFVMLLFLLFLLISGKQPSISWLALLPLIGVQFVLIAGITSLCATVIPFVPDLKWVVDNGLTMLFFLSGVFFDISALPEHFQGWLRLNPMAVLIEGYRSALLLGQMPDWGQVFWVLLFACILIVVAVGVFTRYDRIYPKLV
jgi:lipopolysaccharide transport system permease protein